MTYNTSNYTEQGGARTVIGGSLDVISGGDLDVESGGTFKIAGTAVTASADELNALASSSSVSVQASKAVIADANKKINLALIGSGATVSVSGLLMGVGADGTPVTTATPDAKWVEIRAESTAPTGDNRLAYLRYDIKGASGGECIRAATNLTLGTNTAHGAHISLEVGATGYVSGLGAGVRSQLYLKDEAVHANGTYFAHQAEVYCVGSNSSLAAVTKHAILNVAANGNATGAAKVLNAIAFDGISGGDNTKMISSKSVALAGLTCVNWIAILINGVRCYMPALHVGDLA